MLWEAICWINGSLKELIKHLCPALRTHYKLANLLFQWAHCLVSPKPTSHSISLGLTQKAEKQSTLYCRLALLFLTFAPEVLLHEISSLSKHNSSLQIQLKCHSFLWCISLQFESTVIKCSFIKPFLLSNVWHTVFKKPFWSFAYKVKQDGEAMILRQKSEPEGKWPKKAYLPTLHSIY